MDNYVNKIMVDKNDDIFKFIDPYGNDMFSKLKKNDLLDLMLIINNYDLGFRKNLGLDKNDTFGMELEFSTENLEKVKEKVIDKFGNSDWGFVKVDLALKKVYEISSDKMIDDYDCWKSLDLCCNILRDNSFINNNCGGHVHVGTQALGKDYKSFFKFVLLWGVNENIIYRFCYGNYLTNRKDIIEYAKPVYSDFWNDYFKFIVRDDWKIEDLYWRFGRARNNGVNFQKATGAWGKGISTIEFRCPNASLDPVIWQNNVNLFVKLLNKCKDLEIDEQLLKRRKRKNGRKIYNIDFYGEIFLEQALEFCDMVFDNNLDKVYFMRQYLKSYQIGTHNLQKAKPFTKTLKK